MTTADDIEAVAAALPTLGRFGFDVELPLPIDDRFLAQVDASRRFILDPPDPRLAILRRGAYPLKHAVQLHAGIYVSVGALIAGAMLEGYEPVRKNPGPNCRFAKA